MKTLRINFTDFWKSFDPENNPFIRRLKKRYKVIVTDEPDYLFFSCYGYDHLKYDCVKIFYTGENVIPDFNICDYAIGFHFIDFGDRYQRIPLFANRDTYRQLVEQKEIEPEKLLNRKFCNFLYSNNYNAHPVRKKFFDKLNEYKKVDSGGKFANNLGYNVPDKIPFISNYKFTIAFENSAVEGYTTEKLVDPMSVNSLPIYWGNPRVSEDFNTSSFIHLKDSSDAEINNAIEKIKYLDQHDEKYLETLKKPWFTQSQFIDSGKRFWDFVDQIFSVPPHLAKKRALYGYNSYYSERLKRHIFKPDLKTRLKKKIIKKMKNIYAHISMFTNNKNKNN